MSSWTKLKNASASRPIARRIGSAVGWSVMGNVCWRALTFVSAVAIARLLTAEDFGAYGLILDTIATFGVLASFRLGSTSTRYVAKYRQSEPERAGRIIKLTNAMAFATSLTAAAIAIAAAPLLARTQLNDPLLKWPLMIAAVAMFFRLVGNVLEFTVAGFEDFKSIAALNIFKGLATVATVVPMAVFAGLKGVFTALAAVAAVNMLLCFGRIAANTKRFNIPKCKNLKAAWAERGIIWSFALPGVLAGLCEIVAIWQSKILLLNASGFGSVGVFNAANQWRTLIMFLPSIIGRAVLPMLSQTFGSENKDFNKAVQVNLRFMWMLALPPAVMLIGFADVLAAIFGKKYDGCQTIIPWLMSAVFISCVSTAARHVLDSAGRRWIVFAITVAAATLMIFTTKLSLGSMTTSAPAIGQLAGYGLLLIGQLVYIEFSLARGQVRKRLWLYLYSIAILAAACWVRFNTDKTTAAICGAVLLAMSVLPLLQVVYRVKKGRGISA